MHCTSRGHQAGPGAPHAPGAPGGPGLSWTRCTVGPRARGAARAHTHPAAWGGDAQTDGPGGGAQLPAHACVCTPYSVAQLHTDTLHSTDAHVHTRSHTHTHPPRHGTATPAHTAPACTHMHNSHFSTATHTYVDPTAQRWCACTHASVPTRPRLGARCPARPSSRAELAVPASRHSTGQAQSCPFPRRGHFPSCCSRGSPVPRVRVPVCLSRGGGRCTPARSTRTLPCQAEPWEFPGISCSQPGRCREKPARCSRCTCRARLWLSHPERATGSGPAAAEGLAMAPRGTATATGTGTGVGPGPVGACPGPERWRGGNAWCWGREAAAG